MLKIKPPSTLLEKIYQYYSKRGILDLLRHSYPFLTKAIIDDQKISVRDIIKSSDIHKFWKESEEGRISISEPDNQRLQKEFKFYPKIFDPFPGAVAEIEDCDLIGSHATGIYKGKYLIYDTSGCRLGNEFLDSRSRVIKHNIKSYFKIRPNRSEKIVFPLISPDPSYYHWMMEYLPKLRLLELYQNKTGKEPILLIESNPRNFVCETLRAAGYDSTQYEEWDQEDKRVKNLIVATHRPHIFNYKYPSLSNYNPSVTDCKWLRSRMRSNIPNSSDSPDKSKNIYISRQQADRGRRVKNQDQLNDILKDHNFSIHTLESICFEDQLKIFYEADVIIGPHGAGLLNMIFAEDPTVIELFPESVIKPHFYFLSDIFGFDYKSVVTESEGNDLIIDPEDLDNIISDSIS